MQTQKGFSLVELMVALALGLLLSAAAIQMFLTSQQSMNVQQGSSEVQENGRFAIDFLMADIRKAGMRPASITTAVATPITGTAGSGTAADTVAVSYVVESASGATDCNGNLVAGANPTITNTYSVVNGALMCEGNALVGGAKQKVELVPNVDGFKVLYGIDTVKDNIPAVTQWVPSPAASDVVLAVQVGLYVHSDAVIADAPPPRTLNMMGRQTFTGSTLTDGKVRRMFVASTLLRNNLNPALTTF